MATTSGVSPPILSLAPEFKRPDVLSYCPEVFLRCSI